MYVSESLEMGKLEVQEQVALGMSLGHCYMILTFQIYISKNAAVKGVSWAVFCSDRGHRVHKMFPALSLSKTGAHKWLRGYDLGQKYRIT